MQWLDQVFRWRDSDTPLVEVLGAPARTVTYRAAFDAATALAARLAGAPTRPGGEGERPRVGLVAHNSPEWVVADLACLIGAVTEVPVPLAFTADQARSLLRDVDVCLVDTPGRERLAAWGGDVLPAGAPVWVVDLAAPAAERPTPTTTPAAALTVEGSGSAIASAAGHAGGSLTVRQMPVRPTEDWICKVIHTSGTTSAPKGVRIRAAGLDRLLAELNGRVPTDLGRRYLSVVPLSLLIEQVAAEYLTMLGGGTLVLLPPTVPLLGTAPRALPAVLAQVPAARPTAMQGPPVLFESFAQIAAAHPDDDREALCRRLFGTAEPAFLACGGAPISHRVLAALADRGIPVYEGYGLSENSSVVSWNSPGAYRPGSVGRPLDHVEVRFAADGELLIRSASMFAGYTGDDPSSCLVDEDGWLHTGDLATQDEDGYLHIRGRKKNIVITAAGRNVAADWVASRYREVPGVLAAVVFGDGLEELVGFFVIADGVDAGLIRAAIHRFGTAQLSDVERVRVVHTVGAGDAVVPELFTVTGRPVRERIWQVITEQTADREQLTTRRPSWA